MTDRIVDIRKLSKQYGKQKAPDEVSFSVKRGSIVGLIGPNGAGIEQKKVYILPFCRSFLSDCMI